MRPEIVRRRFIGLLIISLVLVIPATASAQEDYRRTA